MPAITARARAGEPPPLRPPARGHHDDSLALAWTDAFCVGNGRHGALVFGDPRDETVIVNHHALTWPDAADATDAVGVAGGEAEAVLISPLSRQVDVGFWGAPARRITLPAARPVRIHGSRSASISSPQQCGQRGKVGDGDTR